MAAEFAKGTKLFYATAGTSYTAVAAGSYPATPWVEAGCLDDMKPKFADINTQNEGCLGDEQFSKSHDIQPGEIPITVGHQSADLIRLHAIINVRKAWVIVSRDGHAWTFEGKLLLETGDMTKGIGNRITYGWKVAMDTLATPVAPD